ncbi:hypothetical protein [Halorubellus litoreus]|uniref:Uncharacterized protein n=1 Tax=Halorubellus litoreus TaxID=755308 RepID=A0ABD5VEA9_9EURY
MGSTDWEVFDYERQQVTATFYWEPTPEVKAFFEAMGYWVRPHQLNPESDYYVEYY